ncbi:MAG: Anaerobic dimethyl sulfoxide reductase chain B [candidate division TA06 bacterium ADurb.Bin131]|uniref:Anaerobic dimethyl sulfoxide reductase chain B n=1 Tax=candidate division TA06 bacterium ADurb.Bin131 TaxID=1852827 RepID=A0A1V6C4Z3_UNCT6|nr:MAG: Anaerobic dimethyl sulfoxide reductase chain B [candidate division TA06 bacterium ADurb.Bin131]
MKKLFIDYEICNRCPECVVRCSYIFHPGNNGIISLREQIAFNFACRRCDDYPCVNSCPTRALKREDGIITRSNFMCISCKSCALACPFGTIDIDWLLYSKNRCDVCAESRIDENQRFICVQSCPYGALKVLENEPEDKKHLYEIEKNIIVRVINWLELYQIKK